MLRALANLDRAVLVAFRTRLHTPGAEAFAKTLATTGEYGAVWAAIGLTAAAVDEPRRPRWLRAAAVGPAAIWANYAVKLAVRRERPKLNGLPPLAGAPSKLSFPSAHAASSFAAATAMARVAPSTAIPLSMLAVSLCLTRPYLGMHFPSDVLAGAALGTVFGKLAPGLDASGVPQA